jgi:hypothetical protein
VNTPDTIRWLYHLYGVRNGYFYAFHNKFVPGTKATVRGNWGLEAYAFPQGVGRAIVDLLSWDTVGYDVFLSASLFVVAGGWDPQSVAPSLALWTDQDGPAVQDTRVPTARLETSPGHTHDVWQLTHAIPPERAEAFNRRLATYRGTDPIGSDRLHYVRVPGTRNRSRPGAPVVRLVYLDDQLAYDPEELDRILPPDRHGEHAEATHP